MKKLLRGAMSGGIAFFALGAGASGAGASPALNLPAQYLPPIFPAEGVTPDGALPASANVTGSCPFYLFGTQSGTNATDAVGFVFSSGTGVLYRMSTPGDPTTANGANAQGIATLIVGDNKTPFVSPYSGQTHLWFGSNSNAKGQSYFGETISFHGVTPDGAHSITITANPGGNVSASGNMNSWGHLKLTCS